MNPEPPTDTHRMTRKRWVAGFLVLAAFFLTVLLRPDPVLVKREKLVMGPIMARITVWGEDRDEIEKAIRAAFERIDEIDKKMSDYRDDSEISRIREAAGEKEGVVVSPETFDVIRQALEYSKKTGGAFDVTVRPLIKLWSSRDEREKAKDEIPANNAPPTRQEIDKVLLLVGSDKVELDADKKTVRLPCHGMSIDLGAIAKGYAVDQAAAVLRLHGYPNSLVEIGGDLYAGGTFRNERPWPVGMRDPGSEDRNATILRLAVSDRGVTTSGDYERYRLIAGKQFNHILDPRPGKGRPVEGVRSVTVIAGSCMEADVLSTAITVLGPKKAAALLKELFPEVEFYAIPKFQTAGFSRYVSEQGQEAKAP